MSGIAKTVSGAFGSLVGMNKPDAAKQVGTGKKFTTEQVRKGLIEYAMARVPEATVTRPGTPAYIAALGGGRTPYVDDRFIKGQKKQALIMNISGINRGPEYIYSTDPADYTIHDAVAGKVNSGSGSINTAFGMTTAEARARRKFEQQFDGYSPDLMYKALVKYEKQNPPGQQPQAPQTPQTPQTPAQGGGQQTPQTPAQGGGQQTPAEGTPSQPGAANIVGEVGTMGAGASRRGRGRRGRVTTLLSKLGGNGETLG